eukprot:scaffold86084_cov17-Tisochrysis_lutea.AAC.1
MLLRGLKARMVHQEAISQSVGLLSASGYRNKGMLLGGYKLLCKARCFALDSIVCESEVISDAWETSE